MGQLEELEKSIQCYDQQCVDLLEKLDTLRPTSKEYKKTQRALREMLEIKNKETETYIKLKQSMVPDWFSSLLSIVGSIGLGLLIYNGEKAGAVIGSTATTMFNKLRF